MSSGTDCCGGCIGYAFIAGICLGQMFGLALFVLAPHLFLLLVVVLFVAAFINTLIHNSDDKDE